ncbi:hypothetical protein [Aeromicrobium sp. NPDC092404]|uniref:hypothetical protein n=1 Tax=Aeromicrobium sp. NPDC092404 TaxID=3154976 RepID=UPI0034300196
MRRTPLVVTAILLLTAGCGGSDDPEDASDGTTATPTTTTALTPSTTTPAPGPGSTLIDYGDDEVTVASAGDVDKLTGAPEDFKAFVVADLQRQQDTKDDVCTEKPEIRVARVDVEGWAAGGTFIPQCGGSAVLWAKVSGTWQEVWGGQTLPDCAILEKYRFPATVAGKECGTADGGTRGYPA